MKILLLDVYPKKDYRISKDQNGAYGTANNYGTRLFSKIIKKIVKSSIDFPPLYSVQTCGELINANHEVDYNKELDTNKNYDLYIMPSSIVCHETEIEYIKKLKSMNKIVVVIGPFVTSNPENYLKAGAKIIKGEPEMYFNNFKKEVSDLPSLPQIIENFPTIALDNLSLPGWEVIFKNFIPRMKFLGSEPAINIHASRGCPYSCFHYCVYPLQQGRKLRFRSPEKLVTEMKYFYEKLNVRNFIFRDPVFSINRKHTIALCNKIIEINLKLKICVETHLNNIDSELAQLLKKAGVRLVYTGIESADENVREDAHRISESNLNQIEKVKFLEDIGIKVKAMYIIGLPADTKETYIKTLNFAKKVNSSYAQFNVFTPYPGTPVFSEYKNKITQKFYENFNQCQLTFEHKYFSPKDILDLLNLSYKEYYLNFKWVFSFLKRKLLPVKNI